MYFYNLNRYVFFIIVYTIFNNTYYLPQYLAFVLRCFMVHVYILRILYAVVALHTLGRVPIRLASMADEGLVSIMATIVPSPGVIVHYGARHVV